jgi:transcriptional regulator with XRE-family HTH domain
MTRHSYHERDSTFGQAMFKLRTSIGLTQADLLGVSRHAVGEWEGGLNYSKAEHFKHFLTMEESESFSPQIKCRIREGAN